MIKINLLPRKKKTVFICQELIIGAVCLLLLFSGGISLYVHLQSKMKQFQKDIKTTKEKIENSKIEVKKINKLKKDKKELEQKLSIIKDMKLKQTGPAPLLKTIANVIPEKIWLTSLSSQDNRIILEGMSLTANSIAYFMKNLENTSYFSNIELDNITQTIISTKKVKKFKITCNSVAHHEKKEKKDNS